MITTILAVIGIGTLIYVLGNTPNAREMERKIEAGRDKHRRLANKLGIRL
jgi:hypothetical protein